MSARDETRIRSSAPPELRDGVFGWSRSEGDATILFLGRGTPGEREAPLPASWIPAEVARARLKQVHGAEILPARPGLCGEGDALITNERGLALEIATADCVPILLVGASRLGAVHAGWRGIASGVVGRAVATLGSDATVAAWIGPAIGPCCYEVEESVAEAVAAAAPGVEIIASRSERGRPLLDLVAAVEGQLRAAGVARVGSIEVCTRLHPEWLRSYRREGAGAGRNLALVWRD